MSYDATTLLDNLFASARGLELAAVPIVTPKPDGPSADDPAMEAEREALGLGAAERVWTADAWQPWEDCLPVESVQPCPTCGSLELWWDLLGGVHCQHCQGDVFRRSMELLDLAENIRGPKSVTKVTVCGT